MLNTNFIFVHMMCSFLQEDYEYIIEQ